MRQLPLVREKRAKRRRAKRPAVVKSRVAHRRRPEHRRRDPVLVTLRMRSGLPNLRAQRVLEMVRRILDDPRMPEFQAVHYSIQSNHVHLIVEADDKPKLSSGLRSLIIRIARRLNLLLGRKGRVLDDRYHRRDLLSPTEVRNALRYVLGNFKKHGVVPPHLLVFDSYSSAVSLDVWIGFEGFIRTLPRSFLRSIRPRDPWTWLLRRGWQRAGQLSLADAPVDARAAAA